MERRRLAGMKPASLFHHRKIKKFLKNEKEIQGQQLVHWYLKIFPKKEEVWQ